MSARGWRYVVIAAALLMACSGCGGGGSSSSGVTLPKAPTSGTTGATNPAGGDQGLVGTCHLLSRQAFLHQVDHSAPVPCSHPHNAETAGIHPVYTNMTDSDARSMVAGYGDSCGNDYYDYLRLHEDGHVRLWVRPTATTRPDGTWVVRCDVLVESRFRHERPLAVTTTSLGAQARSGRIGSWVICTELSPRDGVPLVPCTRPHRYEGSAEYETLTAYDGRYPSAAQLLARGHATCRRYVAHRRDASALTVQAAWISRRRWVRSDRPADIVGACYFSRTDGRDLPPVR